MNAGRLRFWEGFLPDRAIVMARPGAESPLPGPGPKILFVGEGLLEPGPERQLLDRMVEALGLAQDQVEVGGPPLEALAPVIQARTPGRVVTLGLPGSVRGQWSECAGVRALATHSPAQLLQNPALKREAWDDLKAVAAELGLEIPARGGSGR